MPHDDSILAQATEWAVRVGDPAFEDWDAFTRWLSESPANPEAYDRVSAAVAEAVELDKAAPRAANDEAPAPSGHARRWYLGALAASVAAVLAVGVWQTRDDRYRVETAPGELRSVALADGGKIDLAGGTRLELDRDDPRFASLERGQALFTVRHDASRPFSLKIGEDTVVDVGTVFDARRDTGSMSVAVAEGSVILNPEALHVQLKAGDVVVRRAESADYRMSKVPIEQIGEWREGRLTFRQSSLGEIAERLSRATGVVFTAAPGSEGQAFSGSVLVAPLRGNPRALGPLLGVSVTPAGNGWVIGTQ
jgi:transmembrane sensor